MQGTGGAVIPFERSALDGILGTGLTPEDVVALDDGYLTDAPFGDGEAGDNWIDDWNYEWLYRIESGWTVPVETYTLDDGRVIRFQNHPAFVELIPPPVSAYVKKPVPVELRWAVFRRDGYRCVGCGYDADLTADHIHPEVKGGRTGIDNLQTLCRRCNSKKGAR
jgi:hypothetical protein